MGCGGALVGGGNCSSRGVTGTVQMRSFGSVRSVTPARRIMYTLQVPERRLLQRPTSTLDPGFLASPRDVGGFLARET